MFMTKLRKQAKLFLWVVVGGFVAWIFFDLGADLVGKTVQKPWEQGLIAEVDGKPVSYDEFYQILEQMRQDSIQAKGGRELTDQEESALLEAAWRRVIEEHRWQEIIRERKLFFSDPVIVNIIRQSPPREIRESPEFQDSAGNFNYEKYLAALQNPRNLPYFVRYEQRLRRELPKELMRIDIILSTFVTDEDAWVEFVQQNERVKVKYVKLSPALIPDTSLSYTEADLRQYYEENRDAFQKPLQVNLSFVMLQKRPSREDTLAAKERALTALSEIRAGTPFEEAVKYYSEDDNTRDRGGDLGWRPKKRLPPPLVALADSLEVGEVGGPVFVFGAWDLIKVEGKKDDSLHLRVLMITIKTSGATKEALRSKAQELRDLARSVGLDSAAKALNLEVKETGPFDPEKGFVPFIGRNDELLEFAKTAEVGALSHVLYNPRYFLVAQLKERIPPHVPPFEEIKDQVERAFKEHLKEQKIREIAEAIAAKARETGSLEQAVQEWPDLKLTVSETRPFNRIQSAAGIPPGSPFHGAAFALSEPGAVSDPVKVRKNYYVLQLLERQEPDPKTFEAQKETIKNALRTRLMNQIWNTWNRELVEEAQVKDYRRYLLY